VDHREVIATTFKYWAAGDVDMSVSMLADDVVHQLYVAQTVFPFGGAHRGIDEVRQFLFSVLEMFDVVSFEATHIRVEGDRGSAQCRFDYIHRASGERLCSTARFVITFRDGLIASMDEYHDEALLSAFMRLTEAKIAENGMIETDVT